MFSTMALYFTTALIVCLSLYSSAAAQFSPNDTGRSCGGLTYDNGNLCVPCPPGTLSDASGFRCRKCPPGKYYLYGKCAECPAGNYLQDGFICTECFGSEYSDIPNSPKCLECPANTTTVPGSIASTGCFGCGRGEYLLSKGDGCKPCWVGSYQDEQNQEKCKPCPEGMGGDTITYIEGLTSPDGCIKCPPGTASLLTSSVSGFVRFCSVCPNGYFSPVTGASQCMKCPAGSVSTDDRLRCVPRCDQSLAWCQKRGCPPGTEPIKGDVRNCRKCPAGKVNDRFSVTSCAECIPSLYPPYSQILKPSVGRDACACPDNEVIDPIVNGTCTPCRTGTAKVDERTCKCPPGQQLIDGDCQCKYRFKAVGKLCLRCSQAEIVASRSTPDNYVPNICGLCLQGSYFNATVQACAKCPEGFTTYSVNDRRSCVLCRESYYDSKGKIRCGCKPGTLFIRRGVCRPCAPGTVLPPQSSFCQECGGIYYSDVPGLTKCKVCPKGRRYSLRNKQKACPPACPVNSKPVNGRCQCSEDYFFETENRTRCVRCPINEVQGYDMRRCRCKLGYTRRGGKCEKCPAGTYGNSGVCYKCNVNTITPREGMEECRTCAPGAYSIFERGTRCTRCPTGRYVTKKGGCGKCAPGFRVRNGECVPCVNSVSDGGDVAYCRPCPMGKIPSANGRTCTVPRVQ